MASPTTNKSYQYAAHGGSVGSWDTQLNLNIEYQDLNFGGYYQITASTTTAAVTFNSTYATIPSTGTSITFATSLAENLFYNLVGARSQNLAINMPAVGSIYCFANNSSGVTTTTVLPTGGSGVTIPQGGQCMVVTTSTGANYAQNVFDTLGSLTVGSLVVSSAITTQSVAASSAVTAQSVTASSAVTAQSVTASSGVSGAIATGSMIATQANQETGTATNLLVTPGTQKYHESAAKAHGRMVGGVTGGIDYSYGVTSNTRTSAGDYKVTFSTNFSGVFYTTVVTPIYATPVNWCVVTQSASNVTIKFQVGGADFDPQAFCIACFGDQ